MEKKIFYIGNFSFPHGNASGTRVFGNGCLLRDLEYDVSYIGLDKNLKSNSDIFETKQAYKDFTYYNLPYPVGIKGWLSYKQRFKEVISVIEKEKPFAVITYGSPTISLFGKLLKKWCRNSNVLCIADCVDWLPAKSGNIFFRITKYLDTTYQKRFFNSNTDGVITVSSFLSNYYKKKQCKTVIIPPLVDISRYKVLYSENKINEIFTKRLIYVGQPFALDGRKVKKGSYKDRIDIIIDVLYQLKKMNFIFDIYGLTRDQYLKVIPEHKYKLNSLNDKVRFHGFIDNNDAIIKIADVDFTVLLRNINKSTTAGFPTKFVESISCGTPIVTTKTSDLESYIEEGKSGYFVDIENIDILTNKFKEIFLLKKERILEMKNYCRDSELFSFKKYVHGMNSFINQL
ncbi:glycosyltransferase family 4 protein [Bacteroidota bacterium]